jgi:hypothetical protein
MVLIDLIYNLALLVALSVVSGFVDMWWKRNNHLGVSLLILVYPENSRKGLGQSEVLNFALGALTILV